MSRWPAPGSPPNRPPEFVSCQTPSVLSLQAKEALGISVRKAFSIGRRHRQVLQKCASLRHRLVGIVYREHDARRADLQKQVLERGREIKAAERVVHILSQIGLDRLAELGHFYRQISGQPRQHEWDAFAQMSDDDLKLGIAVEHAAKDHADEMDGRLDMPTPTGCREGG